MATEIETDILKLCRLVDRYDDVARDLLAAIDATDEKGIAQGVDALRKVRARKS